MKKQGISPTEPQPIVAEQPVTDVPMKTEIEIRSQVKHYEKLFRESFAAGSKDNATDREIEAAMANCRLYKAKLNALRWVLNIKEI